MIIDDEERSKGRGFMARVKNRWDTEFPNRTRVSKQNLRDHATRFRKEEATMNEVKKARNEGWNDEDGQIDESAQVRKETWTNEMKIKLIMIENIERAKGRGFMKRMKDVWDRECPDYKNMSAQNLLDNVKRFKADKSLQNVITVRDVEEVEVRHEEVNNDVEYDLSERESVLDMDLEDEINQADVPNICHEERVNTIKDDDNLIALNQMFIKELQKLKVTTNNEIECRTRLSKIRNKIKSDVLKNANIVLSRYLEGVDDMNKITDAVYAMGKTIEKWLGITRKEKKSKKKGCKNRRIRNLETKIKGLRQNVTRISNEIHRRRVRRKATKKEKKILKELKNKTQSTLSSQWELKEVKEKWLDEFRYCKVKLRRIRVKDARVKNNKMFQQDEGMFYQSIRSAEEKEGKVPPMTSFVDFWAGIWEDESVTPNRQWMEQIKRKITSKITSVEEFEIDKKILEKVIKKRKNWSAPGIDGIPNFWWKKLCGAWDALVKSIRRYVDNPECLPTWLTYGRTVLLPKTKNLNSEKDYRPITCLNTSYKIFTGMLARYVKDHADRNNIWDKSQLGACEGVLGTIDQLLIDNCIMDEVRNYKRNLAVSFYDYQKAYDMVRHDWIIRVYKWIGLPNKVIRLIESLMAGWQTRLEVNDRGRVITSRWIKIRKGFLQGDSYSPVGFCLSEVPVGMLLEDTEGYLMGEPGNRSLKRTHSLFIDDLKVYQRDHNKLKIANEVIVKASQDTGACYGVKKCAEIVFERGRMISGEGLEVLTERMKALDPSQNEVYKFLGCEQGAKMDVKAILKRVKAEMQKRMDQLIKLELYDKNLIRAINCRVIPVAAYIMNVCNLGKGELEELDMIIKRSLRQNGLHGKQSSDERLYMKRANGGRGLKSLQDVYKETKVRVACYMATSHNPWIRKAWLNEVKKEYTSIKRTAEEVMQEIGERIEFDEGEVKLNGRRIEGNWKEAWKGLKVKLKKSRQVKRLEEFGKKLYRVKCCFIKMRKVMVG